MLIQFSPGPLGTLVIPGFGGRGYSVGQGRAWGGTGVFMRRMGRPSRARGAVIRRIRSTFESEGYGYRVGWADLRERRVRLSVGQVDLPERRVRLLDRTGRSAGATGAAVGRTSRPSGATGGLVGSDTSTCRSDERSCRVGQVDLPERWVRLSSRTRRPSGATGAVVRPAGEAAGAMSAIAR